jgi:hypothetical protein
MLSDDVSADVPKRAHARPGNARANRQPAGQRRKRVSRQILILASKFDLLIWPRSPLRLSEKRIQDARQQNTMVSSRLSLCGSFRLSTDFCVARS